MVIHLLKKGEEIIYVFEDLKEAIEKAMAEQLCIVRLRINKNGTVNQMVIYEPRIEENESYTRRIYIIKRIKRW